MSEQSESNDFQLKKLFVLMEKSDSINCLPPERIEIIKGKYRNASPKQVINGILMLEKDIAEKELKRRKAVEALEKNSGKIRQLHLIDEKERQESATLANEMLKGMGGNERKRNENKEMSWKGLLYFILALSAAGVLAYLLLGRTS